MATKRQFSRGVAWMTMGNWSEQIVNLAVFTILVRLLGADPFGLLTMAMALVLIGEGLVRETLSEYIFSAPQLESKDIDALFWALAGLGGGLSLLLVIFAPQVAEFYDQAIVRDLLWATAPIVAATAVTAVPVALLRRKMNIKPLAARAFWGVVTGGIVGVVLAFAGAGVWALAAQRLVLTLTNVVIAWRAAQWRPGPWPGLAHLTHSLPFGRSVVFWRMAEMGNIQLPSVVIGAALGPVQLGYYVIAWRLVELFSFLIVTPMRMAALPAFSAGRAKPKERDPLLMDTLRLAGFIAIPSFAGLSLVAPEALFVFGGAAWLPAAPVMSVLAFFGMYLCLAKIEETYAIAHGRVPDLARLALINLVLSLGGMTLLSPLGLPWMAGAMVAGAVLITPMRLVIVARDARAPLWIFVRQQLGPVVGAVGFSVLILGLRPWLNDLPILLSLAIAAAIGVAFYSALALRFMTRRLAMAKSYLADLRRGSPSLGEQAEDLSNAPQSPGPNTKGEPR